MENQEFWLEVIKGKSRGQTFRLISDFITVGRRLTAKERKINWLLLDEPSLSRIHAVLQWNDEIQSFELFHKSSARPTLVNNRKVDQIALSSQDKIQMGDIVFRFWEGPIEKKFDYYLNEEAHEDETSSSPVKQSFTPLDLQQKKSKSQEGSAEAACDRESTETSMLNDAAIWEERKIVKAVERGAQQVQEFKPLVFTQFNEADKEEMPAREKVFYSQKEQQQDISEFTPLRFSSDKPSAAPPERESPLKKTSKVEQYLNGRGGKASPGNIKPVNLIKDMSAQPPQKRGKLLGASEERNESAASFTALSFSKDENREPVDGPRETKVMLSKQSSSSDTPASFKPVSLIQPRAVIDSQSYKGRGRILGSQNKEEDDAEESEHTGQTFQESRNGSSAYLSSTRMTEEASHYRKEENEKENRQDSVRAFNLLKPQSPRISSQSYGEAATGSTVENKEEQLPALVHDEALDGDGQFFDGLGEIPMPPLDEATTIKENEQPSPGYRPLRIRSKTQVRYSGWNKELSSRERNATRAAGEIEAKPVSPAAAGEIEAKPVSPAAAGEIEAKPVSPAAAGEIEAKPVSPAAAGEIEAKLVSPAAAEIEIKQVEPVSPVEAEAGTPSHQKEGLIDNESEMEYASTSLTPPLDLIDYDEGAAQAGDTIISEKQSEEPFEMLTEASLQPPLQLEETAQTRLLSRRGPHHQADTEAAQQLPTGEMLQPHLLPPDTPRSAVQPLKHLFRSKALQSQEMPEPAAHASSPASFKSVLQPMEPPGMFPAGETQKPMESPTLFSYSEVQQPMESPTLFSCSEVQKPMEPPALFPTGEVQKPMEPPALFPTGEVQKPMEPPALFPPETMEQIWTTLVPERMQQHSVSNPDQPWTPQMPERVKQPVKPLGELIPDMPELSWTPTIPETAHEPIQPPVYFSSEMPELTLASIPPDSAQDQLQPTLQLSLEMPELPWMPQKRENVQNQLQPTLQLSTEAPYPSEAAPTRLLPEKKKKPAIDSREQTDKLSAPWDKRAHTFEKAQSLPDERGVKKQTQIEHKKAEIINNEEAIKTNCEAQSNGSRLRAPWEKTLAKKREEEAATRNADYIPPPPPYLNKPAAVFNRSTAKESKNTVKNNADEPPHATRPPGRGNKHSGQTDSGDKKTSPVKTESAAPVKPERSAAAPQLFRAIPQEETAGNAGAAAREEPAVHKKEGRSATELKAADTSQQRGTLRPPSQVKDMKQAPLQKTGKSPVAPQEIESAPSWENVLPASPVQRAKPAAPQKAEQAPLIMEAVQADTGSTPRLMHTGADEGASKSAKIPVNSIKKSPQQEKPQSDFNPYNAASKDVMEFFLDNESNGVVKPAAAVPPQNIPYDSFKARMNRQMQERQVQGKAIPSPTVREESEKTMEAAKDDARHLFHSWKPPQDLQPVEAPPGKDGAARAPASSQMKRDEQNQLQAEPWEILLIQSSGEEEGKYYPINKSSITIGKSEGNDIIVQDTQLAPVHLKIYCEGTTFFLQKMEKTQPVFINGKILATSSGKVIMDGDLIQISGKTKMVFRKQRS